MDDNEVIKRDAVRWISNKANKRRLIDKYASLDNYPSQGRPILAFTAGSPGAGKTEFIKGLCKNFEIIEDSQLVVIDPDAIREDLPGYTGANSYLFQNPVSISVGYLYRSVVKHKQDTVVDGTFANYELAKKNIELAIGVFESIEIYYVFQHPGIAWRFTQLRETVEGRNIRKEDFVSKFLKSKTTSEAIKGEFGDQVKLHVILKDYKDIKENKQIAEAFLDIVNIEDCIDFDYTEDNVKRILDNENEQKS